MRQKLAGIVLAGAMLLGTANGAVVVRIAPPPPVRTGVIGIAPSRNHVWVNGFHEWRGGRYVWHEGYWVARPHAGAEWVDAHWAERRGGWVFVKGHWRR